MIETITFWSKRIHHAPTEGHSGCFSRNSRPLRVEEVLGLARQNGVSNHKYWLQRSEAIASGGMAQPSRVPTAGKPV